MRVMVKKTKPDQDKRTNKLQACQWGSLDSVAKRAIDFQRRSKEKRDTYISNNKKLTKAYRRSFDMDNITIGNDNKTPAVYRSALGRILSDIFIKSIVLPIPEIQAVSRQNPGKNKDRERQAMELASVASGLIKWGVRESFLESVFNRAKETWISMGDVFIKFFVVKGKKREMIGVEYKRGTEKILDPDGKLIDSGSPSDDTQADYDRVMLSEEKVISMFGKDILQYVMPGSHFDTSDPAHRETPGAVYYELTEGMNKAREEEVSLLGANAFPVMRFAEDDSFKKEFIKKFGGKEYEKLKGNRVIHGDKYRYYDSLGNPYINDTQLFCFYDEENPTNFGMQQKVYALQYLEEIQENGKVDSFRREIDNITYVTGMRPSTYRSHAADYRERKKLDLFEAMVLPPSLTNVNPSINVLEYPSLNPLTAKQATDNIMRLARNVSGADPNRLEIQKNEGLGLREQLTEERAESVQQIINDNLFPITKLFEKLLNFIIVHEGFGLNDVFIDYTKFSKSPKEGVAFLNKGARINIVDAAKKLRDANWDIQVSITKDSLIKKSNSILLERILSFMERVNPETFPELYKKLILTLNELLPTNIVAEDIIPQAPAKATGGASQFQSRPNGAAPANGVAQAPGGVQPGQGAIGPEGPIPQGVAPSLGNPQGPAF